MRCANIRCNADAEFLFSDKDWSDVSQCANCKAKMIRDYPDCTEENFKPINQEAK
jgi:hypothetical protein